MAGARMAETKPFEVQLVGSLDPMTGLSPNTIGPSQFTASLNLPGGAVESTSMFNLRFACSEARLRVTSPEKSRST